MTTCLVIEYVRRVLGDDGVKQLIELTQTGYSVSELLQEHHWFSHELKQDLFEAAATLLDDPHVGRRVGASVIDLKVGTSLKLALKAFGNPQIVYQNAPRVTLKFQATHEFEVVEVGKRSANLRVRAKSGKRTTQVDCDYMQGLLSIAPCLFGAAPAKIRHRICAAHGDEFCEYNISWERSSAVMRDSLLAGVGGAVVLTVPAAILGLPELAYAATAGVPFLAGVVRGLFLRDVQQRHVTREMHERFMAQEDELERLTTSMREVVSDLKIDEVLKKIVRHASAAVDGKEYALLLDVGRGSLEMTKNVKLPEAVAGTLETWANERGRFGRRHQEVEDVLADPILAPLAEIEKMPVRSLCAAPLNFRGERLGLLIALSDQIEGFFTRDLELLATYAAQAAAAIANARLYSQVQDRASHDALTGLMNHRQFHDKLAQEIARSKRYAARVAIVLIDIDSFAALNEARGNAEGDRVLRKVAEAITSSSRAADSAFRVGADEFALTLPEAGVEEARKAAVRAAAAIVEWDAGVTVSCGVAAWPESGPGKEEILKAAEGELNRARLAVGTGEDRPLAAVDPPDETRPVPAGSPTRETGEAGKVVELKKAHEKLLKKQRQLLVANTVGATIDELFDADEICGAAVERVSEEFSFYMVEVDQVTADGSELVRVAGTGRVYEEAGHEIEVGKHRPIGTGLASRVVRSDESLIVDDVQAEPYCFVSEAVGATRSELCVPIKADGSLWGALYIAEPRVAAFDTDDLEMAGTIAEKIGTALHKARLYGELEGAYVATVEALSGALEAKDSYMATHAREMADKAVLVGRQLGLDEHELRTLRYGALFHDIGKIAISGEILNKPSALTEAEFSAIGKHTVIGEQILAPVPFLRDVLPIVRHAHERWDGRGYPDGLSGDEIPLGARIVFVCDAYSAMTSERPYRSAMSKEAACEEVKSCAGDQFDPEVVDAFLAAVGHSSSVATEHGRDH